MTVLLQVEHVRVEFDQLVAVDDVSFELAGGELLGLVGPNGAGKTTLLRVLTGLHAPTRGAARIMGKPVLGEHEMVRHQVGFAPDAPPAYEDLTIEQFLRFIAGAYRLENDLTQERIDFWLEHLWLTDKRHTLIKNLSRGMRQRVTLARTFLPQPHVILLDEPLSGLDPAGRIELRRVLAMLRDQGCAMILSSHILADLEEVATHIAILEQGHLLRWSTTEGMHQELRERRTYSLTLAEDCLPLAGVLAAMGDVTNVEANGRSCVFEYVADDVRAAALLRGLIERSVPVVSFGVVKTSLEEAYLKAGVKQVD